MKTNQEGNAVILVLVILLACSGFILAGLQTAYQNGRIVYWDGCHLQAWQAADAGLAWAHCQLAGRSFGDSRPVQAELTLKNGAHCIVSSTSVMKGNAREYSILAVGSYQGATYQASRKFTVLPP